MGESKKTRIIFLTGGVCSSVGKGIAISSVAALLKSLNYKVKVKKCDPYLNVDPGTLSPYQHGEVFVTADGVETDLDIGHYERFTHQRTIKNDYITSGRVYWDILNKERLGGYEGKTVQVVPHVIDYIKELILQDAEDVDFLLCEIGGTVGDIEAAPFYEAIRQIKFDRDAILVHVAYMPYMKVAQEVKTKPVQHSLKELLSLGLRPEVIVCRSDHIPDSDEWKQKISDYANLENERVVLGSDVDNTYEMLCMYKDTGLLEQVGKVLGLEAKYDEVVSEYSKLAQIVKTAKDDVVIGIVGKYTTFEDSYKSLKEALFYSATLAGKKLKLHWLSAEDLYEDNPEQWALVKSLDGIVVPGGFGERGAEGMIKVIRYARENNVPFLGICLGMQLVAIEAARHLLDIKDACSIEFSKTGTHVIDLISKLLPDVLEKNTAKITGIMRVGEYESTALKGSQMEKIYSSDKIYERFRHRYEMNHDFIEPLQKAGIEMQACSYLKDEKKSFLVDALVSVKNDFFVSVQYHPEFVSRPLIGHKLFNAFIEASLKNK